MNVYRVCWTGSLLAGTVLGLTGCEVHEGVYYHRRPATVYVQAAPPPPAPVYVQAPPPAYVPAPAPAPVPVPGPPPAPDVNVVSSAPPAMVVEQAPPPAVVEVVPVRPGPEFVWVGGFWEWRGRWVWSRGHWGYPPRHGAIWVQPRWVYRGHSWHYAPGRWR